MNYLRQLNDDDCAIVCLINAFIFLGYRVNKKRLYKQLKKILKFERDIGVQPKHFDKIVKAVFYNITKKQNPKLKDLEYPCILGIDFEGWCHVGVLVKSTKHYVYLVNWGKDHSIVRKVKKDTLKKWLNEWSVAYILKRS